MDRLQLDSSYKKENGMILLKWIDISGKTFICNPAHIISVSTDIKFNTYVNFLSGYYIEIRANEVDRFAQEWYLALNKEK